MFNAMIPASRFEDSPFWEQKEQQQPQDHNQSRPSWRAKDEEMENFHRQRLDMEDKMQKEIERARTEAFKQLPWLWETTTNREQSSTTTEQRSAKTECPALSERTYKQDANTRAKATPSPAAASGPAPTETKHDPSPDTEEQAYLFLNFPHARDQLQSLEHKLASLERDQADSSSPSPLFAPLMRPHDDQQHQAHEQAETDRLLHTLRDALRGVEPWERARVTEQLPEAQRARDELRERQCPWGRGHGRLDEEKEGYVSRKEQLRRKQEQKKQERAQEQKRESPERTVRAPWWWLGAIWDPTFPRDADGYGMRRCRTASNATASSSCTAGGGGDDKATSDSGRAKRWDAQPGGLVLHPGARRGERRESETFTSSLTTTTSSTTQPDGSILTRIVMEKRHPDGRDERNETVFTQQPGKAGLPMQRGMADPWGAMGLGSGMPSNQLEPGLRRGRDVSRMQNLEREQEERRPKRGWFWAS